MKRKKKTKFCTKCGIEKELKDFGKDKGQSSGLKCACRACQALYKDNIAKKRKVIPKTKVCCRCNEVKPSSQFYKSAHQHDGLFCACKECEDHRLETRREQATAYWHKRYLEKQQERHLIRKYGITRADRQRMLEAQNHKCAICGKPEKELRRGLVVDHCHDTGKVRGLLCQICNQILGAFPTVEILLRADSYLNSGGGVGADT